MQFRRIRSQARRSASSFEAHARLTPFRALRHYVSAGERLPPQIWSAWEAAGGHPILDGLGCSELVYMVIGNTPQRRRPGSSGLAMPGVELRRRPFIG